MKMNPHKTAFTLAILFGGVHIVWAVLVAMGWAQPLVDFIQGVHMTKPTMVVTAFDFGSAITLVLVASAIGYALGNAFAMIWNRVGGR